MQSAKLTGETQCEIALEHAAKTIGVPAASKWSLEPFANALHSNWIFKLWQIDSLDENRLTGMGIPLGLARALKQLATQTNATNQTTYGQGETPPHSIPKCSTPSSVELRGSTSISPSGTTITGRKRYFEHSNVTRNRDYNTLSAPSTPTQTTYSPYTPVQEMSKRARTSRVVSTTPRSSLPSSSFLQRAMKDFGSRRNTFVRSISESSSVSSTSAPVSRVASYASMYHTTTQGQDSLEVLSTTASSSGSDDISDQCRSETSTQGMDLLSSLAVQVLGNDHSARRLSHHPALVTVE